MENSFKTYNKQGQFERQLDSVINLLYSLALRMVRNRQDAEDIVQETVLRAFKYFNSFRPGSNFKAWIVTILRSIVINEYHRKKRQPQAISLETISDFISLPEMTGIQEAILREKLHEAIDALPDDFCTILTLFYLERFSYKEIASILDIPMGTVMSRLFSARQLLKQALFVEDKKAKVK